MGVGGHARALGLGRAVARGARPHVRARDPRGPGDVARLGPVRQRRVRRPELLGDRVLVEELAVAELLPGRALVLAGGDPEDVVVGVGHLLADLRDPLRAQVVAEVLVARRRLRRRARRSRRPVLVVQPVEPVRAVRDQLDAVLAEGVLHPVPVHALLVVERLRLVEEVGVEARDLRPRDVRRGGLRVAEDRRARCLRDVEVAVGEVAEHERDLPLLDRRLDRGVLVVRVRDRLVVGPAHVVLVLDHLRVQRLQCLCTGHARTRESQHRDGAGQSPSSHPYPLVDEEAPAAPSGGRRL